VRLPPWFSASRSLLACDVRIEWYCDAPDAE
jgi:hypothetical protein